VHTFILIFTERNNEFLIFFPTARAACRWRWLPSLSVAAGAVQAQAAAPAESTMVKLIRGLMQSGALNKDAGEALLAQAQSEAGRRASPSRRRAGGLAQVQPGDVRVPYISQTVRDRSVTRSRASHGEAKAGGWAAPNEVPDGPSASASKATCACATNRASTTWPTAISRSTGARSTAAAATTSIPTPTWPCRRC
jgi:hypothetical protein